MVVNIRQKFGVVFILVLWISYVMMNGLKLLKIVIVMLYVSDILVVCVCIGNILDNSFGSVVKQLVIRNVSSICSVISVLKFGCVMRYVNVGQISMRMLMVGVIIMCMWLQ